jgi:hypothetical protein
MEFLLSHWHCIIPAIAIIAASLLLKGKPVKDERENVKGKKQ